MIRRSVPLAASEILDQQFLAIRSNLLDLAAVFDRLDRATDCENTSSISSDTRLEQIQKGLQLLLESVSDRAERMQMIFSLPHKN